MQKNTPSLWRSHYPFPKRDGHKYDRGHALIYGGEVMTGAARLGARAAQRIGAGLVTLAAPPKAVRIYAEALESVIVKEAKDGMAWRDLLADPQRNAVLIGPGLGLGATQARLVLTALSPRKPCVLDADGMTNFEGLSEALFPALHEKCVMTPHEGEFARVFGTQVDAAAAKPDRARQAAKIAGCVVLLKGAETIIAAPDGQTVINDNAPPWLATAGSGDVLAGLILGLMAQGMPVFWAAAAAAWVHGQIATNFGPGLIAEDLVNGVPVAVKGLL
jgi:hydroxyethylthiazole kinase-like uncharacterized protein yjeF